MQIIPVHPSIRNQNAASANPDNVLKVNDKGQQIVRDSSRSSPSSSDATKDPVLIGGVNKIVWLNPRRRIVLGPANPASNHYGANPFGRLTARGPSFLPSGATPSSAEDAGPDQNVALLVFGYHGQVTLLSSRQTDREALKLHLSSAQDSNTPPGSNTGFFSSVLQSSLYTPNLQPSPITLDSPPSIGERGPGRDSQYNSPFSTSKGDDQDQDAHLTHLAIGMPANDSSLLVASKRSSSPSSLIDLTEISIDLQGETITMITRPLQPTSLTSAAFAGPGETSKNSGASPENEVSPADLDGISILTWAEMSSNGSDDADSAAKSASLRLIAASSQLEANISSAYDSADTNGAASSMRSTIAVWDLVKAENELSDAFASLECRKTGHAPKWLDWQLRFAQTRVLPGRLITSLLTEAPGLAIADQAILTALTLAPGKSGLLSEQLSYFDLRKVELVEASTSAMPARSRSRFSHPVISSNGALIATLSNVHHGASSRSIVMWKLPNTGTTDEARSKVSEMLALSCLRKSDASDISRAFGSSASDHGVGKLLVQVGDLLKITDSKRQDVLVKIEGATQKGPSHDTNSIPFHHALRLLKIRMAMGPATAGTKSSVRLERLVLELGLCFQVLRMARTRTEVTITQPPPPVENKKKSGAAAKAAAAPSTETRIRVYYRLESVWPLLAQLQWFLTLLDGVSKLALATSSSSDASKTDAKADGESSFERDFVQMLNKPTPRRLVLQIAAHFCDFIEWIQSTIKKENLPPATGITAGDEAMAFFSSTSSGDGVGDGRVLAVSEQMSLARDALRLVVGEASIDLGEFARLLANIEAESSSASAGREADRFWWATLSGTKAEMGGGEVNGSLKAEQEGIGGVQAKLLSSIVDPESGALVDVLTLFVSPSDISDERNVLYEKSADQDSSATAGESKDDMPSLMKALSTMSAKRSSDESRRDIVRKVSLRNAVTQSAILNDAATLLRTHSATPIPATQRLQPPFQPRPAAVSTDPASGNSENGSIVKLSLMRAKRCVRCSALSQDPVSVTYSIPSPPTIPGVAGGMMIDPSLPPQIQMQMQMMQQQGAPFMSMGIGAVQPQPRLVGIEVMMPAKGALSSAAGGAFRYNCLCGGSWWVI